MRFRLLEAADRVAHFLYEPATLGRRCVAYPASRDWLHRIRLIPTAWFVAICDRYETALTGDAS
ncbi:hypothetical protein [Streptodolium elevatio]|uniref:Uncharacterized protein n=1 Tax=Streptodolium elevatio TaxID=3157996 RepID=A0ABV3DK10_9ACTN